MLDPLPVTKLKDLPNDFYLEYYHQMPQIAESDIRLLWHMSYYDGPLDGILLYKGKMHRFQIFQPLRVDEVKDRIDPYDVLWNDHYVRYLIIELTSEQIAEEEYWHRLFQQKVGTHTDYDETGRRTIGATRPRELWNEFYELYQARKPMDLSDNVIVGWFESLWGSSLKTDLIE